MKKLIAIVGFALLLSGCVAPPLGYYPNYYYPYTYIPAYYYTPAPYYGPYYR
jgi:hypothetical protein